MHTHEQLGEAFIIEELEASNNDTVVAAAETILQELDLAPIEIVDKTTLEIKTADDGLQLASNAVAQASATRRAAIREANTARRAARVNGTAPRAVTKQRVNIDDPLGLYLNEMGKTPLLSKEDERILSQKVQDGLAVSTKLANGKQPNAAQKAVLDEAAAAKDAFIRSNLRLVVSIAKRYPLPQGMALNDLIQEGNLGLEHAVDKFEWQRGFKFSTYATFWIRQSIGRALDQKANLIRLPGDQSNQLRAAMREAKGDSHQLDEAKETLHRLVTPVSLDSLAGDDNDASMIDLLPDYRFNPEDATMVSLDEEHLIAVIDSLGTQPAEQIKMRFGLGSYKERMSFREIGDRFGCTAENVRRHMARHFYQLRENHPELEELLRNSQTRQQG